MAGSVARRESSDSFLMPRNLPRIRSDIVRAYEGSLGMLHSLLQDAKVRLPC